MNNNQIDRLENDIQKVLAENAQRLQRSSTVQDDTVHGAAIIGLSAGILTALGVLFFVITHTQNSQALQASVPHSDTKIAAGGTITSPPARTNPHHASQNAIQKSRQQRPALVIFFPAAGKLLLRKSNDELGALVKALKANRSMVHIVGHTDNQGGVLDNAALSLSRAETLKRELVRRGVAPADIVVEGFGQDQPMADNASAEGRQKNRRVEIFSHKIMNNVVNQ